MLLSRLWREQYGEMEKDERGRMREKEEIERKTEKERRD